MTAIISEKGQVTIPKAVRDKLGLRPGTVLDFEAVNGTVVAKKQVDHDLLRKWRGCVKLPFGLSVDEYLRLLRDGDGD